MNTTSLRYLVTCLSLVCTGAFASEEQSKSSKDMAQNAVNPLTTTITVPIQFEYNEKIGPEDDGTRSTVFVQPIVPFDLGDDWNLITRTIVPFIEQDDIFPGAGSQQGIGDISESLFFSPDDTIGGWTLGFGPYLQFDTATDDYLGFDEHGAGASFIALKVDGHLQYGFLTTQMYSIEGHVGGAYSNTFIQPFFDYTTDGGLTWELTSESNYNWNDDQWSIPVTVTASQFFMVGDQPILLGGGFKYWVESGPMDPEGVSLNINLYLLFPK